LVNNETLDVGIENGKEMEGSLNSILQRALNAFTLTVTNIDKM
jgi:hypothetical protein